MGKVSLVLSRTKGRVLAMDSIAYMDGNTAEDIIVCASHGGASAGHFVLERARPRAVVFNDAGIGKDQAGISALTMLEEVGIAAATVSHNSARIGDGGDTWESGIISHVNPAAAKLGLKVKMSVKEACDIMLK